MELALLARLRGQSGLNAPATEAALTLLGRLPEDVAPLYRDHDGSPDRTPGMAARLMPCQEAYLANQELAAVPVDPTLGRVLWLWTDDLSNYAGIFVDGLLCDYVAKLDHEEPLAIPAWSSVESFLTEMVAEQRADLIELPREFPSETCDGDSLLSQHLRELFEETDDPHHRQLRGQTALAMAQKDEDILRWLDVDDEWLPESALGMLRLRGYRGPQTEPIERLVLSGTQADVAALRLLVSMQASAALERVRPHLPPRLANLLKRLQS